MDIPSQGKLITLNNFVLKISAVKENDDDVKRINSAELLQGRKEGDRSYHSLFSSWCANLCDGMTLSFSKNGPDGINQAAGRLT